MEETKRSYDRVELYGTIDKEPVFSHKAPQGRDVYRTVIRVERTSGKADLLPVLVAKETIQDLLPLEGKAVKLGGRLCSRYVDSAANYTHSRVHLELHVFASDITVTDEVWDLGKDPNFILLKGTINKAPVFRTTPLGRKVTDVMLDVYRHEGWGHIDHIPCLFWNMNAELVDGLPSGTEITFNGRIESREYEKKLEDGTSVTRTVYEVSARTVTKIDRD